MGIFNNNGNTYVERKKSVRRLAGLMPSKTRSEMKAQNNLGVVRVPISKEGYQVFRNPTLEIYDAYLENRQYNHLTPWEEARERTNEEFVRIRKRKPRIILPFAKLLSTRTSAKLFGNKVAPKIQVEDDPNSEKYYNMIVETANLRAKMLSACRVMASLGSVFVRFYFADGNIIVKHYNPKFVFPEFSDSGELKNVMIRYLYFDKNDRDENGDPKKKWYRVDLTPMSDILYDNPEFEEGEDPTFNIVDEAYHEFGFVQGTWFKTVEQQNSIDGYSLIEDVLDFIDELCYNISQTSNVTEFNQDPLLILNKMTEDEISQLIRSSERTYNLGSQGEARLLEASMNAPTFALELRQRMTQNIGTFTRLMLHDPEKMVGAAQSAKAMEILHEPMTELIDELRQNINNPYKELVGKIALANLILKKRGEPVAVQTPEGFIPSFNYVIYWREIFALTLDDIQRKVSAAVSATSANLISRETGTKYLAKEFGVENIEEEIIKIAEQPVINPFFGGF